VNVPFLTGFFQSLVHAHRACLGSTAQREFHGHNRETQKDQAEDVDQYESTAAVFTGHPGKLPHVAATDGTTGAEQDEPQSRGKTFAFFHNNSLLDFTTLGHYSRKG